MDRGPGNQLTLSKEMGWRLGIGFQSQLPSWVLLRCTPRKATPFQKWKHMLLCFWGRFLSIQAVSFLQF